MNEKKYMDLGGKNSSEMLKLRKAISICMRDAVTLCCLIFFVVVFFSISINDLFSFCLVGPSGPSLAAAAAVVVAASAAAPPAIASHHMHNKTKQRSTITLSKVENIITIRISN